MSAAGREKHSNGSEKKILFISGSLQMFRKFVVDDDDIF
jgi:hypothetical protein